METKHTPGARRAAIEVMTRFVPRSPAHESETLEIIAGIIDAETAAPELLAALEDCEEYICEIRGNDELSNFGHPLLCRTREAIKKAKG